MFHDGRNIIIKMIDDKFVVESHGTITEKNYRTRYFSTNKGIDAKMKEYKFVKVGGRVKRIYANKQMLKVQ